jgi:hypothetical protein
VAKGKRRAARRYTDLRAALLQEEIDRRWAAFGDQLTAMNRAIDKAEGEMNRRLEGMNEFRDAMRDQAARMLTRDAFDIALAAERDRGDVVHGALSERVDKVEALADRQRGRQAMVTTIVAVLGVVIAAGSLVVLVLHIKG